MMNRFIPNVDIPVGSSGDWKIKKIEVSKEEADRSNLFSTFSFGVSGRYVDPGIYTGLFFKKNIIMSDTRAEKRDHYWFVHSAFGSVLVTGLGIGMVANALLLKDDVSHVTVIEKSNDVLSLVAKHYLDKFGEKLTVILDDAFTWVPNDRRRNMFDFAWHDIWSNIYSDNWDEMKRIKRHYQNWCKKQFCWCEAEVKYLKRTGR